MNRLTGAASQAATTGANQYNETLTYDELGNIISLVRNNGASTVLNNMAYSYTTGGVRSNQLLSITDAGTEGRTTNYSYTTNGSLVSDSYKTVTSIAYNEIDLPSLVTITNNSETMTYNYDATGRKLERIIKWGATVKEDRFYDDGIEYTLVSGSPAIEFVHSPEGRAIPSSGAYTLQYELKDHLGNTRALVTDYNNNGVLTTAVILQTNDYYAFGRDITYSQNLAPGPDNKYKYNGKEYQADILEYDYGARFYDPVIARWTSVDPLAEKGRRWSPYNYVLDNPLRFHDPDGQGPTDWVKIGNTVTFYADIHSDADAKNRFGDGATDVTADGQDFIYKGSNGRQVELYSGSFENWDYTDGTKTNTVIREPQIEPGKTPESEALKTADGINTGIGLVNSVHGAGIKGAEKVAEAGELGEGLEAFKNVTRTLGVVTTGIDAGISTYEAFKDPTPGNITKAIFKSGLFVLEAAEYSNPFIGVGIAILDATHVTDKIYEKIGNYIGGAGQDKPKVSPVGGNMTL